MGFYTGMQRWLAMRRLRNATTDAVRWGLGGQRRRWLLSDDPAQWTTEAHSWVSEQLASVRTPRGIDTCGVLVKLLRDADGQQRYLWTAQIPSFARSAPQEALEALAVQLAALPLAAVPLATHVEVQFVSIGDIVAATQAPLPHA